MRVSSLHVRALVEAFRVLGHDAQAFKTRAGIAPSLLEGACRWIDLTEFDRISCIAFGASGDPAFGLRWGSSRFHQFDIGLRAAYAGTLREAIAAINELQHVLADMAEMTFEERGDDAVFTTSPLAVTPAGARLRDDFVLASFTQLLAHYGIDPASQVVRVKHAAPAYAAEYRTVLRAPVAFGQPSSSITFRRSALDVPNSRCNSEMDEALKIATARFVPVNDAGVSYAARVRSLLTRDVDAPPLLAELARQLRCSERTLRRGLAREQVSFSQILQEAQVLRARQLLSGRDLSVKQVASAVGFRNTAAFARAFKRQTGSTPSTYRASLQTRNAASDG
ncbi:MAG: hypothetical protein RL385_5305 [Pseudomonadota bacterium]|jgi:AraC-like DNA-binding protein